MTTDSATPDLSQFSDDELDAMASLLEQAFPNLPSDAFPDVLD